MCGFQLLRGPRNGQLDHFYLGLTSNFITIKTMSHDGKDEAREVAVDQPEFHDHFSAGVQLGIPR